jgi:xanthine dehydrogenase accessory factor
MNKSTNTPLVGSDSQRELLQLKQWMLDGHSVVLAQVIATWGSSPRPVGSLMVINNDGDFCGSVSGGCIEGALIGEAQDLMLTRGIRTLEYGVSQQQAWQVGLSCGGSIEILIQTIDDLSLIEQILAAISHNQAIALLTDLTTACQSLVQQDSVEGELTLTQSTTQQVLDAIKQDKCLKLNDENHHLFVRSFVQPYRIFLIGAVHIAQALAPMAQMAGFKICLIDPRGAFINQTRFEGVELMPQWPDEALDQLALDHQSAVVTLSHDPKIDDPALISALNSQAFYIGALGSKRTHSQRIERLSESFEPANLERIKAPIGLDLGGRKPAEIAVAILAQIIESRYKRTRQ